MEIFSGINSSTFKYETSPIASTIPNTNNLDDFDAISISISNSFRLIDPPSFSGLT